MSRRALGITFICIGVAAVAAVLWIQHRAEPSSPPTPFDSAIDRPAREMEALQDTAAIPKMLRDSSWQVRLAAANALRELVTLSPARRATLILETLDREAAAPASGPPRVGSYVPLTSSLRLQYLGLLEEIGPKAADAVRKAEAPTSPEGREWRALALGAVEVREVTPRLRELVINSRDPAVRMTAALYLGWLKDSAAIPALRQALNDPAKARSVSDKPGPPKAPFYPVRVKAARALRELGFKVERQGDTFVVQ